MDSSMNPSSRRCNSFVFPLNSKFICYGPAHRSARFIRPFFCVYPCGRPFFNCSFWRDYIECTASSHFHLLVAIKKPTRFWSSLHLLWRERGPSLHLPVRREQTRREPLENAILV